MIEKLTLIEKTVAMIAVVVAGFAIARMKLRAGPAEEERRNLILKQSEREF